MAKWQGKFGTLRVATNGSRHLVVSKGYEIYKDGQKLDIGQYRSLKLFDTIESVQGLASNNVINAEELADRLSYVEEKNIKFDIVIPPAN